MGNKVGSIEEKSNDCLHICITGTSRGIGQVAARKLIAQGHTVYHACRTLERAQQAVEAAGGGIPMECDLANLESVRCFARKLENDVNRLDVLCLNAGLAPFSGAETPKLTNDGFEECIGVNHIGHFLLANLLYRKLKAQGGGRLVVTASSVHDPDGPGGKSGGGAATLGNLSGLGVNLKIHPSGAAMVDGAFKFNGAKCYKDSKLCNVLFCREAVKRFPGISSYSFTPGFIPTTGLFQPLRDNSWLRAQMLTLFAKLAGVSVTEQVGGDRLVYMATAPALLSAPPGSYFSAPTKSSAITIEEGFQVTQVSKEASDSELAARLWDKSFNIIKKWIY